jgi:hypothetical protein
MSSNSQSVNPVQDLLDRIIELQRRLEDLEPNIRNNRDGVNMRMLGPSLLTQNQPYGPLVPF